MSWASQRKTVYASIFIAIFAIVFVFLYYTFIYKAPTCFDGIQNQSEDGIDCGGECKAVCGFSTVDPVVLWTRYFKVRDGIYNVVAMIENPNLGMEAYGVPYVFRIYDEKNVLIADKKGVIDILSRSTMPVFEKSLSVGERIPGKMPVFSLLAEPEWVTAKTEQPDLFVSNKILKDADTEPKLEVTIQNRTVRTVKDIELTAVISDIKNNTIGASQTKIDSLAKDQSTTVTFTWAEPFSANPEVIEVIPIVRY